MKKIDKDILTGNAGLRNNPYGVPEGYFETFKAAAKSYSQPQKMSLWSRLTPYVSLAAVFVFLMVTGTFFMQKFTRADDFTHEDFLVFSTDAFGAEYYESMDQLADAGLADEDIIEYLIYSGISAEQIEISK